PRRARPARHPRPARAGPPRHAGPRPGQGDPVARQVRPPADPVRPRQGDRKEAVAFMLHQFPIGYLPVAAAPARRQLPMPAEGVDPLAGRRFPPRDHPRADLVDDRDALARARSGELAVDPAGSDGVERPAEFAAGHDPLAELSELEWERRYTGPAGPRWPAAASVPEGCAEPGEPIVLEPDAVLDALGSDAGRVAAPDGTAFTRRSLPPDYLELPYHRYRVLRPLPVWRAVSAPWFAGSGGGVRYRLTHSLAELVALGHLVELTAARVAAEAGTLRLDPAVIDAADRASRRSASGGAGPDERADAAPDEPPGAVDEPRRTDRHEVTEEIAK
ncbi:TNT domain-containing protein, partial [Saccharopolyspora sp. 6T]|uniref:TNT domain-containing protein n=1 Tax=Saccharopolyspora sp. 6T TaxID=2877238 RepID=UPI001CD3609C